MLLQATSVCPYCPWGEPDAALEFGIARHKCGIVKIIDSIQSQPEALSKVSI